MRRARVSRYAIYVLACVAFVLVGRLYTLVTPIEFNVDESQWTVSARRILTDWVVWRSSDLTTSGPLNALVVSWPYLFGLAPSIESSRLTGVLLLAFSVYNLARLASSVSRREGFGMGAAAVILLAIFLGWTGDPDFIHYSSELLSVALIAAFGRIYVDLPDKPDWRWLVCGLIATCLPLAKLQSALFCLLFHAACVGRLGWLVHARQTWGRQAAIYLLGALIPVLVLVAPAFLVGEGKAFIDGYLGTASDPGSHPLDAFVEVLPFLLAMAGFCLGAAFLRVRRTLASVRRWDFLMLSLAIWPVSFLTVWIPGRPFVHYAFYFLISLPLSVLFLEYALQPPGQKRVQISRLAAMAASILAAVVCGVALLPSLAGAYAFAKRDLGYAIAAPAPRVVERPLFAWTGVSPADRMLMWGWEPRLTAYAGLRSADRAAHAEFLIRPNKGRAYFRERMLREISSNPPAIIVDAVRPPYFFANFQGYRSEDFHVDELPPLKAMIDAGYVQVAGSSEQAAVYLRRSLAEKLRTAEIPLVSSARQLVDGSLTERAGDWLDFDPADTIELHPASPEPMAEIWVLTSRGGQGRERGATRIALDIETASGSRRVEAALANYPDWTVIPVDTAAPVTAIRLKALGTAGLGPSLNEVKAFRTKRSGD